MGALLAHDLGTLNPNRVDVEEMVFVLIWVIVGGTATLFGPIIGVVALTIVNEVVWREMGVDQARAPIYGTILFVSVRFLPQGLESLGPKRKRLFARASGGPGGSRPAGLAGEPGID